MKIHVGFYSCYIVKGLPHFFKKVAENVLHFYSTLIAMPRQARSVTTFKLSPLLLRLCRDSSILDLICQMVFICIIFIFVVK